MVISSAELKQLGLQKKESNIRGKQYTYYEIQYRPAIEMHGLDFRYEIWFQNQRRATRVLNVESVMEIGGPPPPPLPLDTLTGVNNKAEEPSLLPVGNNFNKRPAEEQQSPADGKKSRRKRVEKKLFDQMNQTFDTSRFVPIDHAAGVFSATALRQQRARISA